MQEIHITVPKGAKVVIHEEEEAPEVERSLEEKVDDLLKLLEAKPEKEVVYVPMPYPAYPQPYTVTFPYQPFIVTYPKPTWEQPYKVTCGDTTGTLTTASTISNYAQ